MTNKSDKKQSARKVESDHLKRDDHLRQEHIRQEHIATAAYYKAHARGFVSRPRPARLVAGRSGIRGQEEVSSPAGFGVLGNLPLANWCFQ